MLILFTTFTKRVSEQPLGKVYTASIIETKGPTLISPLFRIELLPDHIPPVVVDEE